VNVQLHAFLTSAFDGGEWSASCPGRFIPRERAPGTHWIGDWVGPRAVLDAVGKRKIPTPRRESIPRTPVVQPVAQCYTDWVITNGISETSERCWTNLVWIRSGRVYEYVSKSFWTDPVTKFMLTFGITHWEATQRVMATRLTRLTHKIAIQLHLVAERCTIRSSRSRRPVRKVLDTPS
jgi:hypothetical protein